MDELKELYIVYSELRPDEKPLEESEKQLFDYMKFNIPEGEKEIFYDTIFSVLGIREEYFFKAGFKTAVRLLSGCL